MAIRYIVNGTKRDVMHGAASSPRVVLLRVEGRAAHSGLCALVVPAQAEGLRIANDEHKFGLIAAPSASFDCNTAMFRELYAGRAGRQRRDPRRGPLPHIAAGVACGTARAALEYASAYAKERIAFGRPIVSYQGIAFMSRRWR